LNHSILQLPANKFRCYRLAVTSAKGVKFENPNPERALVAMVEANKTATVEFAAKVFPIIREINSAGVETLQGICECLNDCFASKRRYRRGSENVKNRKTSCWQTSHTTTATNQKAACKEV
jgi:hypothetical protein